MLGTCGHAARRAAATRRGVPGEAWYRRQPGKAWRHRRSEEPAGAAVGRGVPSMYAGKVCSRHLPTRGAGTNAAIWRAAAGAQFVLSFSSNWSADKPQWDQNFSVCWIIVYARSVLVAPPPCEACASRQGMPPPSGVACSYRRGARSAVHAPGQGVPPPLGDSRRRRQRCRGVPQPAHSFCLSGRPTSPSVAASLIHHLRLLRPLVEYTPLSFLQSLTVIRS